MITLCECTEPRGRSGSRCQAIIRLNFLAYTMHKCMARSNGNGGGNNRSDINKERVMVAGSKINRSGLGSDQLFPADLRRR